MKGLELGRAIAEGGSKSGLSEKEEAEFSGGKECKKCFNGAQFAAIESANFDKS